MQFHIYDRKTCCNYLTNCDEVYRYNALTIYFETIDAFKLLRIELIRLDHFKNYKNSKEIYLLI